MTQLGLAATLLGLRLHRLRSRGHKVTRSGVRGQGARFQRSGVKSSELSGQRSEVRSQIQGSVGICSDLGDHPVRPFAIVVHPHAIAHFRPHLRSRGGGAQGRGVGRGVVVLKVGLGGWCWGWGLGSGSVVGVRAWARVTARAWISTISVTIISCKVELGRGLDTDTDTNSDYQPANQPPTYPTNQPTDESYHGRRCCFFLCSTSSSSSSSRLLANFPTNSFLLLFC